MHSRSVLILSICFVLLLSDVFTQMMYFNSILYCASSVKTLVGNCHLMAKNVYNPHVVISTAAKSLKELPELLDNCGKQTYAKIFNTVASKKCINLIELQASFLLKIMQMTTQSPLQNSLLVMLYTDLLKLIKSHQYKQCGFFTLTLNDLLAPLSNSQCIKQGQALIDTFKAQLQNINDPQRPPLLSNITLVGQQLFSTGKTCMQEYNEYFPVPCVGELAKMVKLVSTMDDFSTSASWIWQNVRELKAGIAAIKEQCPKLIELLL